jgi:septum formation protein
MARSRIVLASASPRRRELLAAAGVEFEIAPADVEEDLDTFDDPAEAATALATRKALSRAKSLAAERSTAFVIGADTIVALRPRGASAWQLLGKPVDEADARNMLASLSNSRHQVITAVCVARCPDLACESAFERTWVSMRAIADAEIESYVASGEWRDKAGGYAIQETADAFVTKLEEGGFDNVVGLPVALTLRLLRAAGAQL